jgi:membrane fusion protein, multidrug efflux system
MRSSLFHQVAGGMALVALLALTGCGQGSQSEDGLTPAPQKVTNVTVQTVQPEDLRETFTLPGTLEAWEDLTLAAELAGPVRWIGPREGAKVRKGEPILRIDPETMEAGLARDQADYELQKRQLERMEQLAGQKFVSQQEYDQARRAFEVAEAEVRRSRIALEKSTLRAPVDGIVDCWLVDCGEYVTEGTPVATVVQVNRLKVLVEVPEKDVPFLRTGDRVRIIPAAITGSAHPERSGDIIHLAFKAAPLTRTYLAKVEVDNQGGDLRPGMIVRVGLTRREFSGVIAVPLFSVVDRDGEKVVYVEEDGLARVRPVTLGPVVGERVVIAGGLRDGERLIVQGQQLLTDGSSIHIQEPGLRFQTSGNPEN